MPRALARSVRPRPAGFRPSLGRLSPFCFMGNQVVGNASHLIDGLGRGTQAFALDKSIRIKK